MADDLIPEEIRQFVLENIESVAEMEGLLLMRKSPDSEWKADRLAKELYTSQQQAEDILFHLHSRGFLSVSAGNTPSYQYGPDSSTIASTVESVADMYSKYLVPVTNLIHLKPREKVNQFAEAFRLRKEPDK